jgi:5S rRNA maturation endonuclease (ribonuclease M5)
MKFEDFISRFPKTRKTQQGFLVPCPAHEDSTPSLHVCPERNGGVLLKCFGGCTIEAVVGALGLTVKDLFAESKAVKFTPPVKEFSAKPAATEKPVIEKIYSYRDANGDEVYQALRMKPKSFRQRHKVDGKWQWTMDGVIRVLYRLPEILASQKVFVVEGEKDAENLAALGFCATCNVGGAGKWLDSYSESLAGKDVVICGDNDEAGEKHKELVFESIAETSKTVKILKLPSSVKDASDYIAQFATQAEATLAIQELESLAHPHIKGHALPIYTIGELEADYKRFVRSMGENSFSLGKWLPSLGMKLRALVPGELVFIIGDTGTGKTGLLANIARAALPLPTLFFELELPKELMFERFASMTAKMSGEMIETAYQSADDSMKDRLDAQLRNLCICPVSRLTVEKMENIIMRSDLKFGERPRVVLIDYIQLVSGSGANRREKISDIAEDLKVMAKATRTIVIVTSQIARPKNVDDNWEPGLHDAKESGSIEASCGLLIAAWQDKKKDGILNLRVLKSTKGGTGTFVQCNFDGARMIITEKSKFEDADIPHND